MDGQVEAFGHRLVHQAAVLLRTDTAVHVPLLIPGVPLPLPHRRHVLDQPSEAEGAEPRHLAPRLVRPGRVEEGAGGEVDGELEQDVAGLEVGGVDLVEGGGHRQVAAAAREAQHRIERRRGRAAAAVLDGEELVPLGHEVAADGGGVDAPGDRDAVEHPVAQQELRGHRAIEDAGRLPAEERLRRHQPRSSIDRPAVAREVVEVRAGRGDGDVAAVVGERDVAAERHPVQLGGLGGALGAGQGRRRLGDADRRVVRPLQVEGDGSQRVEQPGDAAQRHGLEVGELAAGDGAAEGGVGGGVHEAVGVVRQRLVVAADAVGVELVVAVGGHRRQVVVLLGDGRLVADLVGRVAAMGAGLGRELFGLGRPRGRRGDGPYADEAAGERADGRPADAAEELAAVEVQPRLWLLVVTNAFHSGPPPSP